MLCYNVVKKDRRRIYLGFGGNVNFFNGFVLPVGVQFSPIEKLDRFSLHIELQPMSDVDAEDFLLQSSRGIRYMFGRKE